MSQVKSAAQVSDASSIEVVQLGAHAGAEIIGLDLETPMTTATTKAIYQALLDHGVIMFRNQDITREQQVAFGESFGDLSVHPFSPNLDDLPEMIVLDNDGDNPPLATDVWHTDETFREVPPMGTILRAKIVPPVGGDTMMCSMAAAFEGLSDKMQQFISGLEAIHDFRPFRMLFGNKPEHREKLWEMEDAYPNPVHPVVRIHPESNKHVLFVNPQFTKSIKGMKEDESDALLQLLFRQANIPEYQYRVRWEENLMVFWDNRTVQHYAVRDYLPARRRMERVTIAGIRPVGPMGETYNVRSQGEPEHSGTSVETYQPVGRDGSSPARPVR